MSDQPGRTGATGAVPSTVDPVAAALAPVQRALAAEAHATADRVIAAARAAAAGTLAEAEREAAAIVAGARAQGVADATAALAGERARGRRRARSVVLAAQRAAYQDLRAAVEAAVLGLRAAPDYPRLVAALTALARADLGPDAVVREEPAGGIVATAPGRQVDYSLRALADRAPAAARVEPEQLWTG